MELNGFYPVFFAGMLGGVMVELLKVASWLNNPDQLGSKLLARYRLLVYWVALFALLLVSGVVTVSNGTDKVSLLRAVQLGMNAPAIVAAYATASVSGRKNKPKEYKPAKFIGKAAAEETPGNRPSLMELLAW